MPETRKKKPTSSGREAVEIGVVVFTLGAIAALVVWRALGLPDLAKIIFFGGLAIHAAFAATGIREALSELNTKPSASELRKFGVIFLAGTGILGLLFWKVYDDGDIRRAQYFFITGGAVFILSFIPPVGRPLYIVWMAFGLILGMITSPVILFILFLVLIVPVGLFFKLSGRDLMKRKLDDKSDSYWEDYPRAEDPSRYVKQF